jgi:hypothetical protein
VNTLMPFYLFFGLLGLVMGSLIMWFIMAEHPFESVEPPVGPADQAEVPFLMLQMNDRGRPVDEETVQQLLKLHSAYVDGRVREAHAQAEAARLAALRAQRAATKKDA